MAVSLYGVTLLDRMTLRMGWTRHAAWHTCPLPCAGKNEMPIMKFGEDL